LHPRPPAALNLLPDPGQALSRAGIYLPSMPNWRRLTFEQKAELHRLEEFQKRVRGMSLLKLDRKLLGARRTVEVYERDRYERRNPESFEEEKRRVRQELDLLESHWAWRKLGEDGPFR